MTVLFKTQSNFTGRNGHFKCSGVYVTKFSNNGKEFLSIVPLTSKQSVANAGFTIHKDDVENLIELLKNEAK